MTKTSRASVAFSLIATLGLAGCSESTSTEPPLPVSSGAAPVSQTPGSPQPDPLVLAADLPRLPTGVVMAVRPVTVMRATYEFAARHPEVMKYVPCYCGCERGGHQDNHDCFVATRGADNKVTAWDTHAIGCEICVDVAHKALQMHNSGASVAAIREAVDKQYLSHSGGHSTPTPKVKRGGASHD